ncbi:hypothetical protein JCM8202_001561 [Rhodotorula sphaerocarpa]
MQPGCSDQGYSSSSEEEESPVPPRFSTAFRQRVRQLRDRKNKHQVQEVVVDQSMGQLVDIASKPAPPLPPAEAQEQAKQDGVKRVAAHGGRSVRVLSSDGKGLLYLLRGGVRHSETTPKAPSAEADTSASWVPEDDPYVAEFCSAAPETDGVDQARPLTLPKAGRAVVVEEDRHKEPHVIPASRGTKRRKAHYTPHEDEEQEEQITRPVRSLPEDDPFHRRIVHIIRTTFSEYNQRSWQKSDRRYRSETKDFREQIRTAGRPFGTNLYGMCKMQGHHSEGQVDKLSKSFWGTAEDPLRTKTIFRALPTLWLGLSIMMEMIVPGAYDLYRHAFRRLRHRNIFADVVGSPHLLFLAYSLVVNRQVAAHFDNRDPRYGWAGMSVFGQFVGGDLFFPDLNLRIEYRPGDILIFHSAILRHCVLDFTGERYAIVAFSHEDQVLDSKNGITKKYLDDPSNWERRLSRDMRRTARQAHPGVVPTGSGGDNQAALTILRHIIAGRGKPSHVLTDNGLQFVGIKFTSALARLGVKHLKMTPHHPQTNGRIERFHKTFVDAIARFCAPARQDEWDEHVSDALLVI